MELFIPGPAGRLQAHLWEPEGAGPRAACAVCHPHPLHGGTMDNTVAFRLGKGLLEAGLAVLRFNFRGVERSEGEHDGTGGEEEDLAACLGFLAERYPDVRTWAGGFSFGARTAACRARKDPRVERLVLAALPVRAYECAFFAEVRQPAFVLMAGRDDFGNLDDLRERFPDLHPGIELDEIPDVDHFFTGETRTLQARVRGYAERSLAQDVQQA